MYKNVQNELGSILPSCFALTVTNQEKRNHSALFYMPYHTIACLLHLIVS